MGTLQRPQTLQVGKGQVSEPWHSNRITYPYFTRNPTPTYISSHVMALCLGGSPASCTLFLRLLIGTGYIRRTNLLILYSSPIPHHLDSAALRSHPYASGFNNGVSMWYSIPVEICYRIAHIVAAEFLKKAINLFACSLVCPSWVYCFPEVKVGNFFTNNVRFPSKATFLSLNIRGGAYISTLSHEPSQNLAHTLPHPSSDIHIPLIPVQDSQIPRPCLVFLITPRWGHPNPPVRVLRSTLFREVLRVLSNLHG